MRRGLINVAMTSQVFFGGAATLTSSAVAVADSIYSLVYTRQPRVQEQFANWQHWYDGGQPDRFTDSDLVLDDMRGVVTVIHDCERQFSARHYLRRNRYLSWLSRWPQRGANQSAGQVGSGALCDHKSDEKTMKKNTSSII